MLDFENNFYTDILDGVRDSNRLYKEHKIVTATLVSIQPRSLMITIGALRKQEFSF